MSASTLLEVYLWLLDAHSRDKDRRDELFVRITGEQGVDKLVAPSVGRSAARAGVVGLSELELIDYSPGSGRGHLSRVHLVAEPTVALRTLMELLPPSVPDDLLLRAEDWLLVLGGDRHERVDSGHRIRRYREEQRIDQLVEANSISLIYGTSGCGKTTLLRLLTSTGSHEIAGVAATVSWFDCTSTSEVRQVLRRLPRADAGDARPDKATTPYLASSKSHSEQVDDLLAELERRDLVLVLDNFHEVQDRNGTVHDLGFRQLIDRLSQLNDNAPGSSRVALVGQWAVLTSRGEPVPSYEVTAMSKGDARRLIGKLAPDAPGKVVDEIMDVSDRNPWLIRRHCSLLAERGTVSVGLSHAESLLSRAFESFDSTDLLLIGAVAASQPPMPLERLQRVFATSAPTERHQFNSRLDSLVNVRLWLQVQAGRSGFVVDIHEREQNFILQKLSEQSEQWATINSVLFDEIVDEYAGDLPHELVEPLIDHAVAARRYRAAAELLVPPALDTRGLVHVCGPIRASVAKLLGLRRSFTRRMRTHIERTARHHKVEDLLDELLCTLGMACWYEGSQREARECFRAAQPSTPETALRVQVALAGVSLDLGSHDEGLRLARNAQTMAESLGNRAGELQALAAIGYALDDSGPVDECEHVYTRAVTVARDLDDAWSAGLIFARLGMLYWKLDRIDDARPLFDQALRIARDMGDPYLLGLAIGDRAHCILDAPSRSRSTIRRAIAEYERALQIHSEAGVRRGTGFWLGQLGRAHAYLGDFDKSFAYLKDALLVHRGVEDQGAIPRHLWYLGQVLILQGVGSRQEAAIALSYLESALEGFEAVGATIERDRVRATLSEARETLLADGEAPQALIESRKMDVVRFLDGERDALPWKRSRRRSATPR